ncbi:Hypothetical Protein MfeM64YM_0466 [Mycoplasmopsis fermentans M64]|uniref:Uncharacterized protein n=1 Tax=Mycoplasmopsis fermentans (strain M64) TaxID=943945 RepID=A0AB32XBL2_MYCFM|nr:Hypothetical Protein MfeM64YM_0466 [Mycoplasmopsis fermentans M64]
MSLLFISLADLIKLLRLLLVNSLTNTLNGICSSILILLNLIKIGFNSKLILKLFLLIKKLFKLAFSFKSITTLINLLFESK